MWRRSDHDPAAVEVMDDVLLGLAADTPEFEGVVGMLPEGTDSVLLVEFLRRQRRGWETEGRGPDRGSGGCDGRPCPPGDDGGAERRRGRDDEPARRAVDAMEAHDPEKRDRFWKMRKAGLPILLSRTTDEKHISFIEDCAIPPEHLPEYTREFQEILDDNDTFATFYAHAGPGVLHIRPLINTKDVDDVDAMVDIADRVTDAVVRLGGSVSGEHGDGRARTQWNRKLYGDDLWDAFRDLKTAFDPDWLLNPGNVCGDHDMRENLRFDSEYETTRRLRPRDGVGDRQRDAGDGRALSRLWRVSRPAGDHRRRDVSDLSRLRRRDTGPRPGEHAPRSHERRTPRRPDRRRVRHRGDGSVCRL